MSRGGGRGGAGRGRGRGGSTMTLDQVGFKKGEVLPPPTLQPPPPYPLRAFIPLPLRQSPLDDYLVGVKQEMRSSLRSSRFFVHRPEQKRRVEKYSDKYELAQKQSQAAEETKIPWDLRLYPDELKCSSASASASGSKKKRKVTNSLTAQNLDSLEEKEGEQSEKSDAENDADEAVVQNEDEEIEEETDYALAYFDNGDNYLDNSDDNDEGPTY